MCVFVLRKIKIQHFESENRLNANLFYVTKNCECPLYLSGSLLHFSDNQLLSIFYIFNIYKWAQQVYMHTFQDYAQLWYLWKTI